MAGLDEAMMTPGEVARQFGVTTKQVANWDNSGILKAAFRTPGGQRRYREADVARLRRNPSSYPIPQQSRLCGAGLSAPLGRLPLSAAWRGK